MRKFSKRALVLLVSLLLIVSQLSAIGATVVKASDGTLYWKMTNKQFISDFNKLCEYSENEDYKITKQSKASFKFPYSDTYSITLYATKSGYLRKVYLNFSDFDPDDHAMFSTIALCSAITFMRDTDDAEAFATKYSQIFKEADGDVINKSFVINKTLYTIKADRIEMTFEFIITPTAKADTK